MQPTTSIRLFRVAAACVLAVLLAAGCSAQRLIYNQADWLLLREMNSYLDLDDEQESRAGAALAAAHLAHRREQMPRLAVTFADASTRAQRGLDEADVQWFMDQGLAVLRGALKGVIPAVAKELVSLSPEQRAHLAARLEERNAEAAERQGLALPREERLARRAERTVEGIEEWTGPLSEEQVALVHELRNAMPEGAAAWLAYTRERQQALLAMLEAGASPDAVAAMLRGWWLFEDPLPPSLERNRSERIAGLVRLVVRLDATLDSAQRAHLVGRLDDLAHDARELAREA